jgi:hypothetical protein
MNISDQSRPSEDDDDEDGEDLEDERPRLSLKAAIAWIGTRDPELTHQVEVSDWGYPLDDSAFKYASSAADAWTRLRCHLATGEITATGIPYAVPEEFDLSTGGWSMKGGGICCKINPELFSELEPVTHPLAPYSAVRPFGVILVGETWFRDIHLDAEQLQTRFPQTASDKEKRSPKKKRAREALKKDAAVRAFQSLFSTPESREGSNQEARLDILNKVLVDQQQLPVSISLFKIIEAETRKNLKKA